MKSEEIIYEKIYMSPRPPPKISFQDNWMKELDSEVAGSSKDTQRIQPKLKTQLSRMERPVGEQPFTQEIEKDVLFGRESTKNSTRTGRPVDDLRLRLRLCLRICLQVQQTLAHNSGWILVQTRTGRPVGGQPFNQLEEKTLTSECKDCHCSCARSRKFPRSRAREEDRESYLIEKHFKPTCSRITSINHSATIRRR